MWFIVGILVGLWASTFISLSLFFNQRVVLLCVTNTYNSQLSEYNDHGPKEIVARSLKKIVKTAFIYLEGKEKHLPSAGSLLKMPATAQAVPEQSHEPGNQSTGLRWV